jgi:hypothetical protein
MLISMLRRRVLPQAAMLGLTATAALAAAADISCDVAIYGGTSGGVVAAVQAARMGKNVVLVEPGHHLGGMTSGGLSAVDIGDPRTIGGITREFFTRLVARYGKKLAWDEPHKAVGGSGGGTGGAYAIEPHVAEEVFEELVKEAGVTVLRDARLVAVAKEGPRISRIVVAGPDGTRREIAAKIFIDTTYEGDLMAAAGVSHTLTREGRDKYDESLAGIRKDRSANGTSASVGRAARTMRSNSRDWPDWMRRSLRGAEGLPYRCRCFRGGGTRSASRSRNSNGESSTTPLAPGRADLRPRPGPTQLAAL